MDNTYIYKNVDISQKVLLFVSSYHNQYTRRAIVENFLNGPVS